jgi:hypothetical protein
VLFVRDSSQRCPASAYWFPAGLKDVIPDSAGKVGGVIKDILPLPGFLKK